MRPEDYDYEEPVTSVCKLYEIGRLKGWYFFDYFCLLAFMCPTESVL